jgi:hypothetical protein
MTFDRRSDDRLHPESVKINLHLEINTVTPCKLIDLSFSSMSLLSTYLVEEGTDVRLDIISEQETINEITGYIVRCDSLDGKNKMAIKFYPFSTMEKYNSMECYHKLKRLINQLGDYISADKI